MNFMLNMDSTLELWAERLIAASWQGGLLLGLAWLLCRYVKPLSATAKCWIWRIAYLKFAVVLLLGGMLELPVLRPTETSQTSVTNDLSAEMAESSSTAESSEPALPAVKHELSSIEVASVQTTGSPNNTISLDQTKSLLFAIWVLGMTGGIVLIARQYFTANQLVRQSKRITQKSILNSYRLLCAELKMSAPPRLAATTHVTTPMLIGAIRPTILIPATMLKSLPPDELGLIIAHELGHAKRRDLMWNWLLVFVRAVFFFHPMVWLTQKRFALDQEIACDQLALETTNGNFQQYGNLLVKCSASTSRGAARSLAAVGAVSSFKTLRERILEMNRMNQKPSHLAGLLSAAAIITGLVLVAPVKLVAQQRMMDQDRTANGSQAEESSSTASSGETAISSATSGQEASNERKDVSVSISNDGVRESIKVKWKNNGDVAVTYFSDANNQRNPQKYNLKDISELEQENAAAFRFYKQHVTSTPGSVSARTGSGRNAAGVTRAGARRGMGVGNSRQNFGSSSDRYRTDDPPSRGVGNGAGAASSSSSFGSSSAGSRNGMTRQSNNSGSSSSSSVNGNANQQLIQQVRDMMEQTDDPMMQSTLRQMLDQLEEQNQNQRPNQIQNPNQGRNRTIRGQNLSNTTGRQNQNRAVGQGRNVRRR